MAANSPASPLSHLSNPLVSSAQLLNYKNRIDSATRSAQFTQAILTQSAGVLLRLPQEVIARSLVLLQRYWISSTTLNHDANTISATTIYTTAKISSTPLSPRSVINVYAYLNAVQTSPSGFIRPQTNDSEPDANVYYVSEGDYERRKLKLFAAEMDFLYNLGFDTHVALPHQLALTYLQALGASSPKLAARVFEHLNGGLLSPQLLYLTHQPNALAVAAIYLGARETKVKLVEENWWETFDVDREALGFLVLALGSLANFAEAEEKGWSENSSRRG